MHRTLIVALVMLPQLAWAQYANPYNGMQWGNPTSAMNDFLISRDIQQMGFNKWLAQGSSASAAPQARTRRHAPLAATDFHPPAKGHPIADAFVDSLAVDPPTREQYRAAVAKTFAALARDRKHNLANAVAVTIGTARSILDGHEMGDRDLQTLRLSVNDALARSPDFAQLDPGRKQSLYDALVTETALLALALEGARRDPALQPTAVQLASGVLAQITGEAAGAPPAPVQAN